MSPICSNCHRFKRKRNYKRHEKDCVPSNDDLKHYSATRSSAGEEK